MKKHLARFLGTLVSLTPLLMVGPAAGSDVEVHGFVSQGYAKSEDKNQYPIGDSGGYGSLNFNDYAINVSKQITPKLRAGMQIVALDRGTYGKNSLQVDWAYGDYRYQDWLGVRVGKIKIPLGLYNASRDNDYVRNSILLPQGLYTEYYRDLTNSIKGAGVYGNTPVGSLGKISYELNIGSIPINEDSALGKAMGATAMGSTNFSTNYKLDWETPISGLKVAVSGLHSTWTGTSSWVPILPATNWEMDPWNRKVYSLEYTLDDLIVTFEYGQEDFDVDYGDGSPIQKWRSDSWYLSGVYRVNNWFEVGSYYNQYYVDRNHRDGKNFADYFYYNTSNMKQHDFALTLRFDPMEDLSVKLEGHMIEGNGLNWLVDLAGQNENWHLFLAKATYIF